MRNRLLIVALVMSTGVVGCTDGNTFTARDCGPGTALVDGRCVASDAACGTGTTLVGGTCVALLREADNVLKNVGDSCGLGVCAEEPCNRERGAPWSAVRQATRAPRCAMDWTTIATAPRMTVLPMAMETGSPTAPTTVCRSPTATKWTATAMGWAMPARFARAKTTTAQTAMERALFFHEIASEMRMIVSPPASVSPETKMDRSTIVPILRAAWGSSNGLAVPAMRSRVSLCRA